MSKKEDIVLEDVKNPSMAKSLVAQAKPRVGGRFVSTKKEESAEDSSPPKKRKRVTKTQEISKDELLYDTRVISDEDKEIIGDDSRKFFEMALLRSRTWSEGYKYARELKPLQHPSLQSTASKVEVEVTQKVLTWEWGDRPDTIDSTAIDKTNEEKKQETKEVLEQVIKDNEDWLSKK